MKLLVASVLLVALAGSAVAIVFENDVQIVTPALDTQWSAFKLTHRKQYSSADHEIQRRMRWESNMKFIEEHNAAYARGEFDFDLAMNHLGDLHHTEVKQMLNGFKQPSAELHSSPNSVFDASNISDLPPTVDWRDKNLVTPVKNQGQCGSCWAFAAIASLEGQHAKKNGALVSLSEQNLLDCSTAQGNLGCRGGSMDFSFQYIRDNGGVDTETAYPYTARQGDCKFSQNDIGATLVNYTDIPSGDEQALQAAIATVGPIAVGIDASGIFFQFYHSGVFHGLFCGKAIGRLDHAVTAVGYGTLKGKDYYLVKNSWGDRWGQKGYIFMSRNRGNNCGIATAPVFPLV